MPFFSYKVSEEDTMKNVKKIIQEGGSQGIKIEGGSENFNIIKKICVQIQ